MASHRVKSLTELGWLPTKLITLCDVPMMQTMETSAFWLLLLLAIHACIFEHFGAFFWPLCVAAAVVHVCSRLRWLRYADPALANPLPREYDALDAEAVEKYLQDRDDAVGPLEPLAASSVHWAHGRGQRTEYVVLFFHGWSSSTKEIDPVDLRTKTVLSLEMRG